MNQSIILTLKLIASHVFLIAVSNILVQYPFVVFGFHTTWGAFTYPLIFILTDLTTRIVDAKTARKIIFYSMGPGLLISYLIASLLETPGPIGIHSIFILHIMPLRIATACFFAYVVGQLMDIFIFQKLQNNAAWWVAPACSTTIGNCIDTILFFTIAFYQSTSPFLSQHWPEIALVDFSFKIAISLIAFVPIYGLVLNAFGNPSRVSVKDNRGIINA